MHTPWTEAEAALLKSLREQALLTPAVFAKRHALSNGQLRELEQGGQGSFYSEDIKAYNGRKLLKALGYTPPIEPEAPPAPVVTVPEEPAPDPAPAETIRSGEPITAPELTAAAPDAPEGLSAPQVQAPVAGDDLPIEPPALTASDTSRSDSTVPTPVPPSGGSTWALAALGLVAAVGVFWVTSGSRNSGAPWSPQRSEPAAPLAPVALPALAPDGTSDDLSSARPAASAASQPAALPAVSSAGALSPAMPAKWPTGCEPIAGKGVTAYQSPVADRPETYVHVESLQDVQVCIVDELNRPTPLNLQAGQSYTVYGTAPFVVRSQQWQHLKIYFQGLRVQTEPGQPTDQVILNPRRGA